MPVGGPGGDDLAVEGLVVSGHSLHREPGLGLVAAHRPVDAVDLVEGFDQPGVSVAAM
jgi:hypothetical protein